MAKNTDIIPFTEICERAGKLARTPDNISAKVRGVVNDVYCREIGNKWDWNFLLVSSSVTTTPNYNTGTVSINTGSQTAVFSSDVSLDSTFTGRKIKFNGNDVVYDFTYSNATGGTIVPQLLGNTNLDSAGYNIFQPTYALASNFSRFPKDLGVYRWAGGKKYTIGEEPIREERDNYSSMPGLPEKIKLTGTDTGGCQLFEFRPAPKDDRVYGYDYFKRLLPMSETTGSILSIGAGATTVYGALGASSFTDATTGDFFRVDEFGKAEDSTWYRIIAIANDSSMTISPAFASSAVTTAKYTISKAPEMPTMLHPAIMYGAVRGLAVDQNDPNVQYYVKMEADTILDAKKIYISRVYNQEMHGIHEDYRYRR